MVLHPPFEISSRLMPALRINGATLSLSVSGKRDRDGRDIYTVWLDLADGTEHEITDLKSGCQGGSVLEGFRALLSFLGAAAESLAYRERMHPERTEPDEDSNETLFPPAVTGWAADNADEISMLSCDIEENDSLIED